MAAARDHQPASGRSRRAVGVLRWLILVAGLAALALAPTASAGPSCTTTATTWTELYDAFQTGTGTVCLGASITENVGSDNPGDDLTVGDAPDYTGNVTLDLAGNSLTITGAEGDDAGIGVGAGATLTITDSVGGGKLNVTGAYAAAGIGGDGFESGVGDAAGTIVVAGGTVTAVGGAGTPGIGGGGSTETGGALGTLDVTGGTVVASGGDQGGGVGGAEGDESGGAGGTVTVTGGSLTATSNDGYSAAIGGGLGNADAGGAGSDLTIGSGGTVSIAGGGIGGGYGTTTSGSFGSLSNAGSLTVESGGSVSPPDGVTAFNSGTIYLAGSLGGDGTIDNTGAIQVQSGGSVSDNGDGNGASSLEVEPNNYALSYADNGGSGTIATQYVYADSLTASGQSLPAQPTPPAGGIFEGWFVAATGDEQVTNTSSLYGYYNSGPASKTLVAGFLDVTTQPQNDSVTALNDASFSAADATATGSTVQWQTCSGSCASSSPGWTDLSDGTDVSGAQSTTLTLDDVQDSQDASEYRAVFTDNESNTVTTNPATLQVEAIPQDINWPPIATTASPGGSATLSATGGASGQPVEFNLGAQTTPGACTINQTGSGTGTVDYLHHGTCVIIASQNGTADGNYDSAPPVSQTVTIGTIAQTISFSPLPASASADSTAALSATGGGSSQPVTFSVDSSTDPADACTVTQSGSGAGTVTFAHAGTCVIDANQAASANGDYAAAPTVSQTVTVSASAVTVTLPAPATTVYGQPATVTAAEVASDGTDPAGSIQFTVDGQSLGAPVTVSGSGTATSPDLSANGTLAPGSHTVTATFSPADATTYGSASASATQVVDQASTTTAVSVSAQAITATVAAVSPGAGSPTGTVSFSVDGQSVGSVPVSGGVATLDHAVPTAKAAQVSAAYSGNADFTGSSASTARDNPTITARVTSATRKTRYGWYRSAVKVSFSCATHGAPLSSSCPAAVTLSRSAAAQSVTRTISATDGGMATVVVKQINIDRVKPTVSISGAKAGAALDGGVPKLRCRAHDGLSGVASCAITVTRRSSDSGLDVTTVHATATATDKAGNRATHTITFTTLGIYLENAKESGGVFAVTGGRTYEIVVTGAARPRYIDAGPAPVEPAGQDKLFYAAGHDRWVLGVTLPPQFFEQFGTWYLGVEIDGKLHSVPVRRAGS